MPRSQTSQSSQSSRDSRSTRSTKSTRSATSEPVHASNLNDRTLVFSANALGRNVDLMCTFEKLSDKRLPYDQQQVCWRVIKLGPTGHQSARATYKANTAFFVPQTDSGNIVYPMMSGQCSTSQRVTLETNGSNLYFTEAEAGSDGLLEAKNGTRYAADIGIGFTDENGENLSPGLVFKKVGSGASVKAEFTPVLKIYATSDYQESQLLRGQITYPLVWSGDLMKLDTTSKLRVTVDPITNVPKIVVE